MWDANRRLPRDDALSGGKRRWGEEADPAPGLPSSPTAFPTGPRSKTPTARSTGRCSGHVHRRIRTYSTKFRDSLRARMVRSILDLTAHLFGSRCETRSDDDMEGSVHEKDAGNQTGRRDRRGIGACRGWYCDRVLDAGRKRNG